VHNNTKTNQTTLPAPWEPTKQEAIELSRQKRKQRNREAAFRCRGLISGLHRTLKPFGSEYHPTVTAYLKANRHLFGIEIVIPKGNRKPYEMESLLKFVFDHVRKTRQISEITEDKQTQSINIPKPKPKYAKKAKSGYQELKDYLATDMGQMKWQQIRFETLKRGNGRCCLCGRSAKDGTILHVDHIKPKSLYPELAFELDNMQILCEDCNIGKSNRDETDWR
jgi:hypothetical protein